MDLYISQALVALSDSDWANCPSSRKSMGDLLYSLVDVQCLGLQKDRGYTTVFDSTRDFVDATCLRGTGYAKYQIFNFIDGRQYTSSKQLQNGLNKGMHQTYGCKSEISWGGVPVKEISNQICVISE